MSIYRLQPGVRRVRKPATSGGGGWFDTSFTTLATDYDTLDAYGGADTWNTSTPGQIHESLGHGFVASVRKDLATQEDQYVLVTGADLSVGEIWVYVACGSFTAYNTGLMIEVGGGNARWWFNEGYQGDSSITIPSGAGTVELRIVSKQADLRINGSSVSTRDLSAETISNRRQGFGSSGSAVITEAEGGNYP